jgi:UDP-N-acetyl-D-mannosaminuronate dehydrogenase
VFPTVSALERSKAKVYVHDPLYSARELYELGFKVFHYGQSVDAGIVHSDHSQYFDLRSSELPGIKTIIDGRGILRSENWPNVVLHTLGRGVPNI